MWHKTLLIGVLFAGTMAFNGAAVAGDTFDDVKDKGYVQCGVGGDLPGFSSVDDDGNWSGIDVAVCHAVAAAMFGDAEKVEFTPLTTKERLTALQSGEVDMLSRNASWTLTRDNKLGINFVGTTFYDGQGFMVKKGLGVDSIDDLSGAEICVLSGTTTELNLADYFRSHDLDYSPVTYDNATGTSKAFDSGRCDALTSDRSQLAALRLKLKDPSSAKLLPGTISKEPLSPAVRQGDAKWFNLVKWTLYAMKNAEFLGVNSDNVNTMQDSDKPQIQRLLGTGNHDLGGHLGVSSDWAYNIIKQVGNYGEIYTHNVGDDSKLDIDRGINRLWTDGGIQYAPPIR